MGYQSHCLWSPRRCVGARNTVGVAGWDADLLIIHPSGATWEIEVKVTAADFRREFTHKSAKHKALQTGRLGGYGNHENLVERFFFAMPEELYAKVLAEIPSYAGVILIAKRGSRFMPRILSRGKKLPARRATDADREKLMQSVYHRYWNMHEPESVAEVAS